MEPMFFDGRPWHTTGCKQKKKCRFIRKKQNNSTNTIYVNPCDEGDIRTVGVRWKCGALLNKIPSDTSPNKPFIVIQGNGIHDAIHHFRWSKNSSDPRQEKSIRKIFRDYLESHCKKDMQCWRSNTYHNGSGAIDILVPPLQLQMIRTVPGHWAGGYRLWPHFNKVVNFVRDEMMSNSHSRIFNSMFNYTAPCHELTSMDKGPWSDSDGVHYDEVIYNACLSIIFSNLWKNNNRLLDF